MKSPINVLMVEDNEGDAELVKRMLNKGDYVAHCRRVETQAAYTGALDEQAWDLILCDYRLPGFSGTAALRLYKERGLDTPFIFVSGTMGEDTAVEAMTQGAHDYVMKNNLTRLLPAIGRELEEAKVRIERRQAMEALRASESSLEAILHSTAEGILAVDSENKLLYANDRFTQQWMIPREVMAGKDDSMLLHHVPDQLVDPQEFLHTVQELSKSKEESSATLRSKGGRIFDHLSRPIMDGEKIRGRVWSFRDITERMLAEEANQSLLIAVNEEKTKLSSLLNSITDEVWFADTDKKFTIANPSALEGFCIGSHQMIEVETLAKSLVVLRADGSIRPVEEAPPLRALSGETVSNLVEIVQLPATGEFRYRQVNAAPVRDAAGTIIGSVSVVRDITERKRAERITEVLYDISKAIASTDNVNELFRQVHTVISSILQAKNFFIALLSDDGKTFFFPYKRDEREANDWPAIGVENGQSLIGEVLKTKGPLLLEETELLDRYATGRNMQWGTTPRSWLGVPLMIKDSPVGVMVVQDYHKSGVYTEKDVTLLESAAGQIAIAIERKRAGDALRESEHRTRTFLDSTSDMAFLKDDKFRHLFANRALCKFYGKTEHEIRRKKDFDLMSKKAALRCRQTDEQTLLANALTVNEELIEDRYYETVKFPVDIAEGKVGVGGYIRDITERKRAEEDLRGSEARYRAVLQSANDAIVTADNNGIISGWNNGAERVFGYGYVEAVGQSLTRLMPDGFRGEHNAGLKRLRAGGDSRIVGKTVEVKGVRKDGTEFPMELSLAGWEVSQARFYTAIIRDISERKKAEDEIRQSEERFRSVWDNSADGMRLTDRKGRIVDVNAAFCRLVKKSREELLGKTLSVAYQREGPDDDLSLYQARFDARETISNLFGSATLWNGESIDLDVSSSFIESAGQETLLLSLFRDVTERRRSEKRLEDERNLLRTIIEAIPDEIAVKDPERRFILVNPATVHALKRSSVEEIIGKRDEDLIPERFALESKEEEGSVIATGCPTINRVGKPRINPSTGEIERSILISKIPLKDSSGKVVGLVGINRDITDVQRASASLEKERTLLLTLIESIPDEICLKDADHRFIVANSAVVRALGVRSVEDLVGKTDLDFASPELAKMHFEEETSILESGHAIINRERIRRNPATGEIERCLLTTKVPVRDKAGEKLGVLVINRYITERKIAEEALRASELKYRALFEESRDAVYISSVDGRLLDINEAGVQMLGYNSKEELLRVDLSRDSYLDPNQRERFRNEMEKAGFVKDFELKLKSKGGDVLTVLETATAVRGEQGRVVMHRGIIRDVTRQRQLELQFLQAQKMESIGTLAGGIAHDFNNILGIVLGHLALLERTRNNDAQFEESIFSINKAVERGASLVRQILTFARKTETQFEPVSINAAIKELAKMLEETFPKTMNVMLQLDKTIPVVSLDPTQLHQALLNLCVNARDAMNGQGTLTIATHLVLGRDVSSRFPKAMANHYVHVRVTDTGTGMDDETMRQIFDPFFTTKEKGKGTGLGLAVVYGVLQAHNGFVDVESAEGAGATFNMFFPVPEGILAPTVERPGIQNDLPRGTETILVVEDEDILRDILVKFLEMQGYKVIPASDGEEAVRRFNEHEGEIDLVLSDMGLPKRSGWDAIKAMREKSEDVRALLASGYLDPGQKSEVLKSGVKGFIQKPYRMEEVLKAIREALDAKQQDS